MKPSKPMSNLNPNPKPMYLRDLEETMRYSLEKYLEVENQDIAISLFGKKTISQNTDLENALELQIVGLRVCPMQQCTITRNICQRINKDIEALLHLQRMLKNLPTGTHEHV